MKKRIISFVILLVFLLGIFNFSFAESIDLIELDNSNGFTASNGNINELFSGTNRLNNETKTKLSESYIYFKNGQLHFKGKLEKEDTIETFITSGEVYLAKNATMKDKVLLADFEPYENLNFARFRICLNEDGTSTISVTIESINNGQLFHFEIEEESDLFHTIKKIANTDLSGEELDKKILQLYNLGTNVINYKNENNMKVTGNMEIIRLENEADEFDIKLNSYSAWDDFFYDLNRYGDVQLSDYDIPSTLFKGGGWESQGRTGVFRVDSYSRENGSGEYLIHIGFLELTNNVNSYRANTQAELIDGMILRYDEYFDEVSVLYYGYPITYKNLKMSIHKLSGNNVFTKREVDYSLGYSGSLMRALIGFVPKLSTTIDSFYDLMPDYKYSKTYSFPQSAEEQFSRYGEYIKGVGMDYGNGYMDKPGNNIFLEGEISGSDTNRVNFYFSFTRSHNI